MKTNEVKNTNNIIVTVKPESLQPGLNEIFEVDPNSKLEKWLDEGIGLIKLEKGFINLVQEFSKKPPIFVQHICPVHETVKNNGSSEDLKIISDRVKRLKILFYKKMPFSVQTRMVGTRKRSYKRFEVNNIISEDLQELGLELNVKKPEQIVSVVLDDDYAYIGVSLASENLSDWAGGKRRFQQEPNQISRAEFKLLEAIDVFNIPIADHGKALDLGAAPGGWTRVLVKYGYQVYAVDPAELDQSLKKNSNVLHFRETAQAFLRRHEKIKFDLIVNDMKMDVKESVSLMGDVSKSLKLTGLAVMTLKLKKKQIQKTTNRAIAQLKRWYDILAVKQLFHNRSEVTVYMRKKKVG